MASAFPTGTIEGEHFKAQNWEKTNASGVQFHNCKFTDCNFNGAHLKSSEFINCSFCHCTLREAEFTDCLFIDSQTSTGTTWHFSDISEATFTNCNLGMCKIDKCEAYQTIFTECAAAGLQFEAGVHKSISKQLLMGGVTFLGCKLQYALFASGQYQESKFEGSDLRDVSFANSNLSQCSFINSCLENTDFTGATLDGANLAHATFENLDLTAMASHQGLMVTPDQYQPLLSSLGLHLLK